MSNIIAFNNMGEQTSDRRFTQKDLIGKIRKIVSSRGYSNKVVDSVVNSFVNNGILETYNELGYQKWMEMINQVIDFECKEGRYGLRNTNVQ